MKGKEGEGFEELMAFFNRTRPHICAQAVGLARAAKILEIYEGTKEMEKTIISRAILG